jgi:hypothetical protein
MVEPMFFPIDPSFYPIVVIKNHARKKKKEVCDMGSLGFL